VAVEAATFSLAALVGQEGFDHRSVHLIRVPDVVEEGVAFDPVDVGLLPSASSGHAVRME